MSIYDLLRLFIIIYKKKKFTLNRTSIKKNPINSDQKLKPEYPSYWDVDILVLLNSLQLYDVVFIYYDMEFLPYSKLELK